MAMNKLQSSPFSGYQAGQQTFGQQPGVQTSMGSFPNLQAYQQQQDAFVQQHLKNQSQYNQGLQSGQSPQRVPVMEAWKQAGENIKSGQYQGNPFQTGNVDALMGMFGQYGIQVPTGFRDQLLQNLGQQSAPPMYPPQPQITYPGGPTAWGAPGVPSFGSPVFRMQGSPRWGDPGFETPPPAERNYPDRQPPMTYPGGPMPPAAPGYGARIRDPGGIFTMEVRDRDGDGIDDRDQLGPGQWPWMEAGMPGMGQQPAPQMSYPGGPMGRPDPMPSVPVQDRVPDSWVLQMPQSSRPNVPPGWSVRDLGRGFYSITTPGQSDADVAAWASQSGATNLSPNRLIPHIGFARPPQPPMTYPGGPMLPIAPGYGERIGLPPGSGGWTNFVDRDGDGIDDRDQLGPGQGPWMEAGMPGMGQQPQMPPSPGAIRVDGPRSGWLSPPVGMDSGYFIDDRLLQPPQAPAAPNPSDPWSYPLRPGHTRGPNGEQIMTRDAREAEIRRMEQESGRTYVRPKAGVTQGGWLPPAKKNPGASISLNPEQAAAMKQYMEGRQTGKAQPTPARTQGTPYRGRRR